MNDYGLYEFLMGEPYGRRLRAALAISQIPTKELAKAVGVVEKTIWSYCDYTTANKRAPKRWRRLLIREYICGERPELYGLLTEEGDDDVEE